MHTKIHTQIHTPLAYAGVRQKHRDSAELIHLGIMDKRANIESMNLC